MFNKITTSMFLLNSVLLAHYFGGAPFHISKYFLILALVTFYALPDQIEAGPNLAYFVLIFQGLGHVSLEFVGASPSRMSINHLVAGILTYHFIVRFDQIIEKLSEWFVPVNFKTISFTHLNVSQVHTYLVLIFHKHIRRFLLRGPPAILAN